MSHIVFLYEIVEVIYYTEVVYYKNKIDIFTHRYVLVGGAGLEEVPVDAMERADLNSWRLKKLDA